MNAMEVDQEDVSASLALFHAVMPVGASYPPGSEESSAAVSSAPDSLKSHVSHAGQPLDAYADEFWARAIRTQRLSKCTMHEMKMYLKSKGLKSSGSREKLVLRIESLFPNPQPQPQPPRNAASRPAAAAAAAAAAPGNASPQIQNLESIPRAHLMNGFINGIVSSAEQLELTDAERLQAFM